MLTPTLLPRLLFTSRTALFSSNAAPPQGVELNRAIQTPALTLSTHTPTSSAAAEVGVPSNTSITGKRDVNASSAEKEVGPQSARPSAPEIAAIKRHCAVSLLALIPRPVARRFFGGATSSSNNHRVSIDNKDQPNGYNNGHSGHSKVNDSQKRQESGPAPCGSDGAEEEAFLIAAIESELLDLLTDEYCNKHLVYSIIETVLVRLVPELAERSVGELMEDRGVSF